MIKIRGTPETLWRHTGVETVRKRTHLQEFFIFNILTAANMTTGRRFEVMSGKKIT
jgi:hypothetical protein